MTRPVRTTAVGLSLIFLIAALVIFIVTAILAFFVSTVSLTTLVGLVAIGLACWVLSVLAP